jgi:hypothetical protein
LPSADLSGKRHQSEASIVVHYNVKNQPAPLLFQASIVQFSYYREAGSLPFQYLPLNFFMPERIQKPVEPAPWGPKQGDGGGPRSPDISRPDTKDLLKKMRKVDPNQSKRYRQRTGQ